MHGIWGLRIRLRVVLVVACLRSARAEKISKLPLLRKVTPQLELPVSLEGGGAAYCRRDEPEPATQTRPAA